MTDAIPVLPGIAALAPRYDGFIVDLWGVVHDGLTPYPGVIDALRRMRAGGGRVCLLSNAPRRVAAVMARLAEIGVPRDAWDHLLTSGEAAHHALLRRPDAFHAGLGRRFVHMGPPRDIDVYQGLDYHRVATVDEAEFVLCTGIHRDDDTVEDFAAVLGEAAARGLPMLCANPDLVVVIGDRMQICAGALAARYEKLGGRVFYHGKPHPPVYRLCFDLLRRPDPARVLAIGDSFRTDMAGAAAAGIDGLLITGGIHAEELGAAGGTHPDADRIAATAAAHGVRPVAALGRLVW